MHLLDTSERKNDGGGSVNTRVKMIAGAADLICRRGVNATTMREVVRHTGTPRGSIGHHFPGGKLELVREAVAQAHREVSEPLAFLLKTHGAVAGLRVFKDLWLEKLQASAFEAGCAVLAVSVEPFLPEKAEGREPAPPTEAGIELLDAAAAAFTDWERIIAAALRKEGVPPARARRLAALVVAGIEGTVGMCRAARSSAPLDEVWQELEALLRTVVAAQEA